jgi:hypothetical protein
LRIVTSGVEENSRRVFQKSVLKRIFECKEDGARGE